MPYRVIWIRGKVGGPRLGTTRGGIGPAISQ